MVRRATLLSILAVTILIPNNDALAADFATEVSVPYKKIKPGTYELNLSGLNGYHITYLKHAARFEASKLTLNESFKFFALEYRDIKKPTGTYRTGPDGRLLKVESYEAKRKRPLISMTDILGGILTTALDTVGGGRGSSGVAGDFLAETAMNEEKWANRDPFNVIVTGYDTLPSDQSIVVYDALQIRDLERVYFNPNADVKELKFTRDPEVMTYMGRVFPARGEKEGKRYMQYGKKEVGLNIYEGCRTEIGIAWFAYRHYQRALDYFTGCYAKNPQAKELRTPVGLSALLAGHADESIRLLQEVYNEEPESFLKTSNLARAYCAAGKNEACFEYLDRMTALDEGLKQWATWVKELIQSQPAEKKTNVYLEHLRNGTPVMTSAGPQTFNFSIVKTNRLTT